MVTYLKFYKVDILHIDLYSVMNKIILLLYKINNKPDNWQFSKFNYKLLSLYLKLNRNC